MRKFDKQIIELANEFKLTPEQVQYISDTFDFIDRLSFVKNKEELDNLCFESKEGNEYVYRSLSEPLRATAEMFLRKGKSVGSFYSRVKKDKNLRVFIKNLIQKRMQPRDFWVDGVLTYKHLKREPMRDMCVEVIDYA